MSPPLPPPPGHGGGEEMPPPPPSFGGPPGFHRYGGPQAHQYTMDRYPYRQLPMQVPVPITYLLSHKGPSRIYMWTPLQLDKLKTNSNPQFLYSGWGERPKIFSAFHKFGSCNLYTNTPCYCNRIIVESHQQGNKIVVTLLGLPSMHWQQTYGPT